MRLRSWNGTTACRGAFPGPSGPGWFPGPSGPGWLLRLSPCCAIACADDGETKPAGESSGVSESSETGSDGTGETGSTGEASSETGSSTLSTETGSESTSDDASTAEASSSTGDPDGPVGTGRGLAECDDLYATYEACFGADLAYAAFEYCTDGFMQAYGAEAPCLAAFEDAYSCISALTCGQIEMRTGCGEEIGRIQEHCPFAH